MSTEAKGVALPFDGKISTPEKVIRRFADIPSIRKLQVPEIQYIVPALAIPRKAVGIWCGPDGAGKTYLAESMAVAVARGEDFLGMACLQCPVLYLDYENPASTVMDRFHNFLLREDEDLPLLKIWGIWEQQQPPKHGSDLLIEIIREVQPLVIIDTFRSFHDQKENESDGMACVMTYLRALAEYGGTVLMLHHPSKTEGSNGRGSSVIHASCDVALMHTLNDEGLITLRLEKNRNGAKRSMTVRADFEQARFEVTDAPYITQRNKDLQRLAAIIRDNPGSTQNTIVEKSGMKKARVGQLLKEGTGEHWSRYSGPNKSNLYSPLQVVPKFPEPPGTTGTTCDQVLGGSGGSPLTGGRTTEPLPAGTTAGGSRTSADRTLPACPHCGSFAIYREPDGSTSCMTCEGKIQ